MIEIVLCISFVVSMLVLLTPLILQVTGISVVLDLFIVLSVLGFILSFVELFFDIIKNKHKEKQEDLNDKRSIRNIE